MRPGTKFGYKGKIWRVTANDTLSQTFTAVTNEDYVRETKTFHYAAGQEIQVRWIPTARI